MAKKINKGKDIPQKKSEQIKDSANSKVTNSKTNNIMENSTVTTSFSQFKNFSTSKSIATKPSIHDKEVTDYKRLSNLCKTENARLRITPYSQPSKECNYTWVHCRTLNGEHKFKFILNEDSFEVLLTYMSTGVWSDKEINIKEGVKEFYELHQNFPLSLVQFEHAAGQKLTFVENKCYSKYKYGMISYPTYNNEDLKCFIESIW